MPRVRTMHESQCGQGEEHESETLVAGTTVAPHRAGAGRRGCGLFGLIQLVPYRVDNPAVAQEPPWDSPRTRQLAVAACFDCHSNETDTYFWEDIAPAFLVDHESREGGARGAQLLRMREVRW